MVFPPPGLLGSAESPPRTEETPLMVPWIPRCCCPWWCSLCLWSWAMASTAVPSRIHLSVTLELICLHQTQMGQKEWSPDQGSPGNRIVKPTLQLFKATRHIHVRGHRENTSFYFKTESPARQTEATQIVQDSLFLFLLFLVVLEIEPRTIALSYIPSTLSALKKFFLK